MATKLPRKRTPASAKKAGTAFERLIADHLSDRWDDRIDRQIRRGARDVGDISGFRTLGGQKIAVECKATVQTHLSDWWRQATSERDNLGAAHAIIVHKRYGRGDAGRQWVTMTLDQLLLLMDSQTAQADPAADTHGKAA